VSLKFGTKKPMAKSIFGRKEVIAIKAYRKKTNPVKRWFRKYSVILFLCGLFLAGVCVGAIIVGLLSPPVEAVHTKESTPFTSESQASVVIETEPVMSATAPFYFNVPLSEDLQDYIRSLSEEYEVPMELILAIIEVESSFNPNAVSGTDDYGYMQINSVNFDSLSEELGITNFFDPQQNILCGIYIISQHLKATDGDITKALMRYNNGPTGAKRLWEQGIYSTRHTDKINTAYEFYKKESRSDGGAS
jgi:hypothetical protein